MLRYPVRLTLAGDHLVMLTSHDVPEAVVIGATEDDPFRQALPVLETALGGYVVECRSIPR